MTKIIRQIVVIVGVLSLPCIQAWSQTAYPIPDTSVIWKYEAYDWSGANVGSYVEYVDSTGVDTVIGPNSYERLYGRYRNYLPDVLDTPYYLGGIRNQGDVAYFIPEDSLNEYVLFDYGANVGDTVQNVIVVDENYYSGYFVRDIIINSVDSFYYNGGYSHQFVITSTDATTFGTWVSRVGSENGLHTPVSPIVSGYLEFTGMCYLDTAYYAQVLIDTLTIIPCSVMLNASEQPVSNRSFLVYPNPNNGSFTIEIGSDIDEGEVRLVNSLGQAVRREQVQLAQGIIEMTGVPKGLYFLQVRTSEGVAVQRVVVQ